MLAFKDEGVKGNVDGVAYPVEEEQDRRVFGTGRIVGAGKSR